MVRTFIQNQNICQHFTQSNVQCMWLNIGFIPRPSYSPVFDHSTGDWKPGILHHVMSIGRQSGNSHFRFMLINHQGKISIGENWFSISLSSSKQNGQLLPLLWNTVVQRMHATRTPIITDHCKWTDLNFPSKGIHTLFFNKATRCTQKIWSGKKTVSPRECDKTFTIWQYQVGQKFISSAIALWVYEAMDLFLLCMHIRTLQLQLVEWIACSRFFQTKKRTSTLETC